MAEGWAAMSDDEMEDYGFEYSDDDAADENVDIENQYYNSKGARVLLTH